MRRERHQPVRNARHECYERCSARFFRRVSRREKPMQRRVHAVDAAAEMLNEAAALEYAETAAHRFPRLISTRGLQHVRDVADIHVALVKAEELQNGAEGIG